MIVFGKNRQKKTIAQVALLLAIAFLCAFQPCHAEKILVKGIVRDSLTTVGLPYASISIGKDGRGVVADENGLFEMNVDTQTPGFTASYQGYQCKWVPLKKTSHNLYDIYLSPDKIELKEVVVRKGKYSKRSNPAVDFVNRLRKSASLTDPTLQPEYSYDSYRRTAIGVGNIDLDSTSAIMRRFPSLDEHVDTSEISGTPILNVSVEEKASTHLYRNNPGAEREIVKGRRSRGVDEIADAANVQTVLDDILREIDVYQSDIKLLHNSFVSPLSAIAPDFYRFYLVDTTTVDGVECAVLAFYPRNKASMGFTGHVYVETADTSMFIHRVEMRVHPDINLNYIKGLSIDQNYERAPNGMRLKKTDNLIVEAEIIPGMPKVYLSRKIRYKNHSFDPTEEAAAFDIPGSVVEQPEVFTRPPEFWKVAASIPPRRGESNIDRLQERLRSNRVYYWGEKILKILFAGYISTGSPSKFDFGPVNTIASYNSLEGLRLRAGGITTANLNPHWFGRGYVAYGFRDHKWKYLAEAEYSFSPKKYHSREFTIHSLRLQHGFDVDHLGSHYLFTNSDNFVLSLTRMANHNEIYRRHTSLQYTLELNNHFSVEAWIESVCRENSRYVHFETFGGKRLSHFTENGIGIRFRYAPGEQFVQGKTYRIPVNDDAPVFVLEHRFYPRNFCGSDYEVNKTEFNFSKRFWLSFLGCADIMVGAGHVWGCAPYTDLLIPNANISYTIQPQSFALMNPMEFVNSSYAMTDITYNARGALFNLVPGLKKLGLREIVGFRALYGHLDKKNIPSESHPTLLRFPDDAGFGMKKGPYMEISAGLDNILTVLRVDYVWRLSYRRVPYIIDRSGLRVALHFTF